MKTGDLVQVLEYTRSLFPALERVTVYGSARFAVKKSADEYTRLRQAGLNRIHMGMESGDDVTLEKIKKGTTAAQLIEAGQKVRQSGIELSMYYLVGVGGVERSEEHALGSARVLNEIRPEFIRLRTLVPIPGTPLYEEWERGGFQLLSPHQALREVRILVKHLTGAKDSLLLSDHVSNYWNVAGHLPYDIPAMLKDIDLALSLDEKRFRPAHISNL